MYFGSVSEWFCGSGLNLLDDRESMGNKDVHFMVATGVQDKNMPNCTSLPPLLTLSRPSACGMVLSKFRMVFFLQLIFFGCSLTDTTRALLPSFPRRSSIQLSWQSRFTIPTLHFNYLLFFNVCVCMYIFVYVQVHVCD